MKRITRLFVSLLLLMTTMIASAAEYSVYFDNSVGNWSKVTVYGWNGIDFGGWPGSEVTEKTPEGYYKVTVTADADPSTLGAKIIFSNNGSPQTADLAWVTNAIYTKNGNTGNLYGGGAIEMYEFSIYFDNSTANWSKVNIYGWNGVNFGGWPGSEVTTKTADGYYVVTVKETVSPAGSSIIFNDGSSQTSDLIWMDNAIYNENGATGKTYPLEPEVPETLVYNVTVPEGTPACYIAGEMNGWTFTSMTKVDNTHYTITFDNVTKSTKYKYSNGESWDYVEMKADGVTDVQDRTWHESDVVEAWKALSEKPEEPETLIYNVTVPEGTNACYIVGDFTAWEVFLEMTQVDATNYTITLFNVTKSMQYKYACGPDWMYKEIYAANPSADLVRTWSEQDVVEAWESIWVSGVNGVENVALNLYGTKGALRVNASEAATLSIYNAQGMLVKQVVVDGEASIALVPGIYFVNNKKVLVY